MKDVYDSEMNVKIICLRGKTIRFLTHNKQNFKNFELIQYYLKRLRFLFLLLLYIFSVLYSFIVTHEVCFNAHFQQIVDWFELHATYLSWRIVFCLKFYEEYLLFSLWLTFQLHERWRDRFQIDRLLRIVIHYLYENNGLFKY